VSETLRYVFIGGSFTNGLVTA